MIYEKITTFVIEKLLNMLPAWLSRRLISIREIERNIVIGLRQDSPININFGTDIPRFEIYFSITNFNQIDLTLDRLLIELWIGHPLFRGAILEKHIIPKRNNRDNLYFTKFLSIPQIEQLKNKSDGQLLIEPIKIHITAYFNSKVGSISIKKDLQAQNVLCRVK